MKISSLTIDLHKERRIYSGAETPNSFNVNCPSRVFRRFHSLELIARVSISPTRTISSVNISNQYRFSSRGKARRRRDQREQKSVGKVENDQV